MVIKTANLTFKRAHTARQRTTQIVVHHSASPASTTILDIQSWHHARDFYGVGYHYVIYSNGDVYRGRPENTIGAHAIGANNDGIGICLCGNFETGQPTQTQVNSLVSLINDIRKRYLGIRVVKHSDVQATACPGKLFPWGDLIARLNETGGEQVEDWKLQIMKDAEKAGIIMPNTHAAEEKAEKWFVLAVCLNLLKLIRKG